MIKPSYFKKQHFYHHFYLPEVNMQVQNGHGGLWRLVPCLKCMELALQILHGHFWPVLYLLHVIKNDAKVSRVDTKSSSSHLQVIWSNLIQSDPIWSNLIKSDPIWSNLIQPEPIGSNLIQFILIWSSLIQFIPI